MMVEQQLYRQQQGRQIQEHTWGEKNENGFDKEEESDENVTDENE